MSAIIPCTSRRSALYTIRKIEEIARAKGYPGFVHAADSVAIYNDTLTVKTEDFTDVCLVTSYWTPASLRDILTPAMVERAYTPDGTPLAEA